MIRLLSTFNVLNINNLGVGGPTKKNEIEFQISEMASFFSVFFNQIFFTKNYEITNNTFICKYIGIFCRMIYRRLILQSCELCLFS